MTDRSQKHVQGVVEAEANSIMDKMNAVMVAEYKAKINWKHSKERQGPWPRKTMDSLWFFHGTEMGTMLETLKHVRKILEHR